MYMPNEEQQANETRFEADPLFYPISVITWEKSHFRLRAFEINDINSINP